jgi:hypothetical protein
MAMRSTGLLRKALASADGSGGLEHIDHSPIEGDKQLVDAADLAAINQPVDAERGVRLH